MIANAAQWLVVVAGVWLIGLGVFMLIQPRQALAALGQMGGSQLNRGAEDLSLVIDSSPQMHPPAANRTHNLI